MNNVVDGDFVEITHLPNGPAGASRRVQAKFLWSDQLWICFESTIGGVLTKRMLNRDYVIEMTEAAEHVEKAH